MIGIVDLPTDLQLMMGLMGCSSITSGESMCTAFIPSY